MAKISKRRAEAMVAAGLAAPVKPQRRREKRPVDWQRADQAELLPFRLQWAPRR